jgi:hypothetical protein
MRVQAVIRRTVDCFISDRVLIASTKMANSHHVNGSGEKPSKANYDGLSVEQVEMKPRKHYEGVPLICKKFCSRVEGSTLWDDIISGLAELRERAVKR